MNVGISCETDKNRKDQPTPNDHFMISSFCDFFDLFFLSFFSFSMVPKRYMPVHTRADLKHFTYNHLTDNVLSFIKMEI